MLCIALQVPVGPEGGPDAVSAEPACWRARQTSRRVLSISGAVAQHAGPWELYDFEADRTETSNLAAAQPDRVRQMITLYKRWAARARVQPSPTVSTTRSFWQDISTFVSSCLTRRR